MHQLDHQNYLKLRENCKVIEQDGFGDKVMILQDGSFLKLFRRKRLISSAAIWPYAQRFADNAKKLEELGIPCPKIIQVYRIPSIERDAVHYYPLPGTTLRDLYRGDLEYPADLRERFLKFVEHIQDLGVYFRSIHLGNVVLTPDDELGLIDISDMKIFRRPLSKWQRKRNLAHMMKNSQDWKWINSGFLFNKTYNRKEIVKFNTLKKQTSIFSKKNDNEAYLREIIKFDTSIAEIKKMNFVRFLQTHGKGVDTLDSFRILEQENTLLFEKTYRSNSNDLKNTLYFYSKINTNTHIKTPKLKNKLIGNKISILLFEETPHIKINDKDHFTNIALLFIKELEKIAPIKTESNIYSLRCYRKSIEFCDNNNLDKTVILKACNIIEKIPLFFAHADLNLNNISSTGIIYDWDSSGYYPVGYDLACIITEANIYKKNDILQLIKHNYESKSRFCSIEHFTTSTLLLSFALTSGKKTDEKINLYNFLADYIQRSIDII